MGDVGDVKKREAKYAQGAYLDLASKANENGDTEVAQAYTDRATDAQTSAKAWSDNGTDRIALHAAAQGLVGGLTGGDAGTLSSVSGVLGGNLGQRLGQSVGEAEADKSHLEGAARDILISQYQQTMASLGGMIGGYATAGPNRDQGTKGFVGAAHAAISATAVDIHNRQLHPDEKARIRLLAGKDANKEARLTAAACAMVQCHAEFSVSSPVYHQLKQLADLGASEAFSSEREQLKSEAGLFSYSTAGVLNDAKFDSLKQFNNTYQIGTRALGAGQMLIGGLGVTGSIVTAPLSCATGVGCFANAAVGTISLDAGYAGAKQLVSGTPENTFVNAGLQTLGLSPQAANIVEATLGIGSAATAVAVANQVVEKSITLSRLSAATYQDFTTNGINASSKVMHTPQAQALITEIQSASPALSNTMATKIAKEIIESGVALPQSGIAAPGAVLIKVVPKGVSVSEYSPYFMSPAQAKAIATLPPEQVGQILGLPASQSAGIFNSGVDFYAISARPGVQPKIFVSEIAPTTQGALITAPNAQQVIVPNRQLWTRPVPITLPFLK